MRSGMILQKIGMSRLFTDKGQHIPVTVLRIDGCQVIAQRTEDQNGYTAVQLGAGLAKANRVSKAKQGNFVKASIPPKRMLAEFRVSPENLIEIGAELQAHHFVQGQKVDATSTSKGRGFAGAMKRHNFGGLRATHGVSISHRSHGSTGQCQDPGKVFKGKKMAGHYGNIRVTTQNLEVVQTDTERGLVLVKGAVPGAKGGWVLLQDAVKHAVPENAPLPAGLRGGEAKKEESSQEAAPQEEAVKEEAPAKEEAKVETQDVKPQEAEPKEEKPKEAKPKEEKPKEAETPAAEEAKAEPKETEPKEEKPKEVESKEAAPASEEKTEKAKPEEKAAGTDKAKDDA